MVLSALSRLVLYHWPNHLLSLFWEFVLFNHMVPHCKSKLQTLTSTHAFCHVELSWVPCISHALPSLCICRCLGLKYPATPLSSWKLFLFLLGSALSSPALPHASILGWIRSFLPWPAFSHQCPETLNHTMVKSKGSGFSLDSAMC